MPPSGPRSSWWRTTIAVGGLLDRLLDRRLDDVLDRLARLGAFGQQQPGLEVHAPGGAEVLGDQQRLDARLVERVEHLGDARRAAPAGADALRQPVQRLALALARVLLDQRLRGRADVVDRRVLDVDGDAARDPLAQIRVQLALELGQQVVRRADQDAIEPAVLVDVEGEVGGVGEVVLDLLLHRAIELRRRPALLLVLGVDVVDEAVGLLQRVAGADEQPRGAAVGDQHEPRLVGPVQHQRLDERGPVEHDLVLDRPSQADDLQQVRRPARVDGHGTGAVGGDVGQQHVADTLDVVTQRHSLVVREPVLGFDLVCRGGQHRRDRRRSRAGRREFGRVQVQEHGKHASFVRMHGGKCLESSLRDRFGHDSRLPHVCGGRTARREYTYARSVVAGRRLRPGRDPGAFEHDEVTVSHAEHDITSPRPIAAS